MPGGIKNPMNRDKVFHITIYSKDRTSGDVRDGTYQIDLPDHITEANKYHIAVEECILASEPVSPGTNGVARTYIMETSMSVPDSHSTSTKTNTRVLCQMCKATSSANSIGYYYKPITTSTYGIPLIDTSMLRNKQMRITFKKIDDTAHDATSMPDNSIWSMTLVIYPFDA
jgi:hypothetical protein